MSGQHRVWVADLLLAAVLAGVVLLTVAGRACPVELEGQPCPDATRNVILVVGLAALCLALAVTPFAFLGEFLLRRRIVYRGAWWRAARRGALAGVVLAVLAGLRVGGAFSVPVAIFIVVLAILVERFLAARDRR